jgi:hypothetical protein
MQGAVFIGKIEIITKNTHLPKKGLAGLSH